ncbi:MAG: Ig domain-containing protein [Acidimicrobiales bacterium]
MERGVSQESGVRRGSAAASRRLFSAIVILVAVLVPLTFWQSSASAKSADASGAPHTAPTGSSASAPVTLDAKQVAAAKSAKPAKSMFPATGYFTTGKDKKGRWYLVTPQGNPFYASGVDDVSIYGAGTDQVTGQDPYTEWEQSQYPNTAAWATATVAQLRSWGFNTLGPYSDDADLGSQMPYEVQLSMAGLDDDWFDPSFVTQADQVAATQVAPLANDPNVIGYFTDSELDWGPLLGSGSCTYTTALACYLNLPAGSPGQLEAEKYDNPPDPSGFVLDLADRYFSVTTAAVRMYDTHHLILGVKAEGQELEPNVLEAAAANGVNVFSVEDYVLWPGFDQAAQKFGTNEGDPYIALDPSLAGFAADFNGPLMIGEYSFMAYQPQTPDTLPGIYEVAPDQPTRTSEYENFVAPLYEDAPWMVGDDWFQYVDEPVNGRTGDGENDNFGLVDVNGNPYTDLVAGTQLMHNTVADQKLDSGPICDSWANSGSGVTCTAYMPTPTSTPLTMVTTSLPGGTVGTSYFFGGVYAAGGTPDYTYTVTQGTLPKGLKLARTTGLITGTPTVAGTSSFTVRAEDSAGSTPVSQALSITVAPDVKVSVTTTTLKVGKDNKSYSAKLAATGGTLPYTWSVTAGALPTGLTLSSGGAITGTPTASGTSTFTVQVVDSTSPAETASANLTLTVDPAR